MTDYIIDAHHHIWDPDQGDYWWMTGPAAPVRRVFTPDDLRPELRAAGVSATVLVQTWSSLDETKTFLETAAATDFIAGVIGWVNLTDQAVGDVLAALKQRPGGRYLVGVRHQVHDEPDPEWLLRADVRRGLAAVEAHGLVYDLLIRPRELPAALRTVRDFPGLRFVIDHIAKPEIATGCLEPWLSLMRSFGPERNHVWCKLSGMVTEADWSAWKPADLAPFVHATLEIFAADRCLYGSDWPVCLLAGSYGEVLSALKANIAHLTPREQQQVLAGSAVDVYGLPDITGVKASSRRLGSGR
jgi:L-fuconolactonase